MFFFDTPDLQLNARGLVVRARRVQKRGDDSVVKLRPVVPGELADGLRHSPSFSVEVDAMPGGFVCSGSMKAALGTGNPVREALAGKRPLRKLFTKEQRALLAAHGPEGVTIDDLKVMGPIFVLKLKWVPKTLGRRMVAEMWLYPDNTTLLELSTKCEPARRSTSPPNAWLPRQARPGHRRRAADEDPQGARSAQLSTVVERHQPDDARAAPGSAVDAQRSANGLEPVAHVAQPGVGAAYRRPTSRAA